MDRSSHDQSQPPLRAADRRSSGNEPGGPRRTAPHGEPQLRLANAAVCGARRRSPAGRKLRREDLLPLGSRIRTRLLLESATPEELRACLDHVLEAAGNASLMTPELK